MNQSGNLKIGILCIFVTTLAFSTMELVSKTISDSVDPFQMTFIRILIGGLILLPLALQEKRRRNLKFGRSDYLFFLLTGLIGIVICLSFFQMAILYTKASLVAVIFSCNPIFTAPLAALLLKEKLTGNKLLSILISLIGVLLIVNPFSITPDFLGMMLAFAAAICFSLYTVIGKKRIHQYGGLTLTCFSFLFGAAMMLIVILFMGRPVISGISGQNILQLLYLGVFVSGIGYYCYFTAMKYTSAIMTSIVFFIKPALASILSVIILGEQLSVNAIIGILFIIAASAIMLRQSKKSS